MFRFLLLLCFFLYPVHRHFEFRKIRLLALAFVSTLYNWPLFLFYTKVQKKLMALFVHSQRYDLLAQFLSLPKYIFLHLFLLANGPVSIQYLLLFLPNKDLKRILHSVHLLCYQGSHHYNDNLLDRDILWTSSHLQNLQYRQ